MNVLIVNPIMYTSETKNIKRANSIKDTMIYDLSLAFNEIGHKVTLFAAEPFKPTNTEKYPFNVTWGECILPKLFMPHCFPYMPALTKYIRDNYDTIDLIICSEVFSLNTLGTALIANRKLIVWHELAKHNAMMKKIPSKFWYNFIARVFMRNTRVIPRSEDAKIFIQQFCRKTEPTIIDHGVNLNKFQASCHKENHFIVCSQLIARKRIDGILKEFKEYLVHVDASAKLYIVGDGDRKDELSQLAEELGVSSSTIFTGKLTHDQMLPYLSSARALLINTEKDNSMISIVESIAVGTPVVTTDVPLNCGYIKAYKLGIANDWNWHDLKEVVDNNHFYVENCLNYREKLSTAYKAKQFVEMQKKS